MKLPETIEEVWEFLQDGNPEFSKDSEVVRIDLYTVSEILNSFYRLKKQKWIKWAGGECPVDKLTLVRVKLRDGSKYKVPRVAGDFTWDRRKNKCDWDIIAYKIVKDNG